MKGDEGSVLVVDDNEVNRDLLARLAALPPSTPVPVLTELYRAPSGEQALDVMAVPGGAELPQQGLGGLGHGRRPYCCGMTWMRWLGFQPGTSSMRFCHQRGRPVGLVLRCT